MKLIYCSDKKLWNDFIRTASGNRGAEFLQSWEWGELERSEGKEIVRVGVLAEESGKKTAPKLLAVATLIKKSLRIIGRRRFYWYSPRGPLGDAAAIRFLMKNIGTGWIEAAKNQDGNGRPVFWRLEPAKEPTKEPEKIGWSLKKTRDLQPKKTLLLDLKASEEELLAAMRQKTRYNIRLAEKKGVEIIVGRAEDFSEFWRLMKKTGARDGFRLHQPEHYRNLLNDTALVKLFLARYRGKNIAAGLFCFWGDKVTYLHGASDNEFREVMAPYLLQWSVIKLARKEAYLYYDFYGLDAEKWPGVTRFKLGFGGRTAEYPGTFDLIYQPGWYLLYGCLRKLRRLF
ncbi:MAG: Methicillin resistance protein [Candidatus Falkowbacteria bacterium GW2011_GWF2_43_32]|nr:MAG: Methicillin resistance protein [Candidatus Falkowbacteria bacterium GW2011_GWF2_43_32]